ncbi:MAG: flagellar protein, partial [Lachnospiraceae bacterium]|nr:flagellar protein [Lachnospiraceae bacterium]
PICPTCSKKLEDKFEDVKEYIYNNPGANINQVAEENDVSIKQIKHWVREERLCFSDNSELGIECEKCGAMIKTGRFCQKCKKQLENSLSNMYETKKEPVVQKKKSGSADGKMRFLG